MEKLIQRHHSQSDRSETNFIRYLHDDVKRNARLNAIIGPRGVGKTPLLFQHILLSGTRDVSLSVFADVIYFFATHTHQHGRLIL